MSLNTPTQSDPEILSGPFGSLLNDLHGISTRDAFRTGRFDEIRSALQAYSQSGVTQPVTPTFGAAARGIRGGRFTTELRDWNQLGAQFTREVFGKEPFASVAPLLDTSGTDDAAWQMLQDTQGRAKGIHTPQLEALHDAGIKFVLGEAVHDFDEAVGLVQAAENTGMKEVIVSFEPTKHGVPNNRVNISSYAEVLQRLQDSTRGKIDARIGMNCGNANQILQILGASEAGTFAAVYPNQSVIPHDENGTLFRTLADLNHTRTPDQEKEFQRLRRIYEISDVQLSRMAKLGRELGVDYIGLCCGASPTDTAHLASRVRTATPDADQRELLVG